ncbi:chromosome partitioning protein ParB [Pusillimonas caeni]|uniref:ParB/RepB/Spo0J family partition protein n=1 Tax=Pusillimonas caeni TaxID=1348472 RepID=UPI000E59D21A|nr:ParB/RepB/Spo0J family partition protein [Pusillimonas caeni]TFL14055.1 chromosome partitioning protein ParB [Pusillimonas caeni]
MTITYIPLSKITLSKEYQSRKTVSEVGIVELAEEIHAEGLLQNLVVVKSKKRGHFEAVAGGRRYRAMQRIVADGRWPKDHLVPVLEVPAKKGLGNSIAENVYREPLHPADEFEAFAELIAQGESVEDVAARFRVTPNIVKGRMKLANVAPELLQAYRNNELSLQLLMAFTITDDQARQMEIWNQMNAWDRKNTQPSVVRKQLTNQAATANHPLARFVGLDAYAAAGGQTYRDLFAGENDLQGIYLQHFDILQSLAEAKLQAEMDRVGEGWAWMQGALSQQDAPWAGYSNKFGRVYAKEGKLTKAHAKQVKELTARIDALSAQMDALVDDEGDEDEWLKLEEEHDSLAAQRAQIHEAAKAWPDEAKQISGVGVYVSHDGTLDITYGLIRPEDRKAAQEAAQSSGEGEDGEEPGMRTSLPAPMTRPTHSERLVRQLSANKVGIVGVELAGRPDIALAVLVAQLARSSFGTGYFSVGDYGLGVNLKTEAIDAHAPDFAQSKAGTEMAKYRQHWLDQLPIDEDGELSEGVLQWALEQDTASLLELLAFILGTSVQGVRHTESVRATTLDQLAVVIGVDVHQWWEPTADSYLGHVSKGQITTVVAQALGDEAAAPLAKLKKGEAVSHAEQLLAGKGWLPGPLQVITPSAEN